MLVQACQVVIIFPLTALHPGRFRSDRRLGSFRVRALSGRCEKGHCDQRTVTVLSVETLSRIVAQSKSSFFPLVECQ